MTGEQLDAIRTMGFFVMLAACVAYGLVNAVRASAKRAKRDDDIKGAAEQLGFDYEGSYASLRSHAGDVAALTATFEWP
jgi:hypothetical protein